MLKTGDEGWRNEVGEEGELVLVPRRCNSQLERVLRQKCWSLEVEEGEDVRREGKEEQERRSFLLPRRRCRRRE